MRSVPPGECCVVEAGGFILCLRSISLHLGRSRGGAGPGPESAKKTSARRGHKGGPRQPCRHGRSGHSAKLLRRQRHPLRCCCWRAPHLLTVGPRRDRRTHTSSVYSTGAPRRWVLAFAEGARVFVLAHVKAVFRPGAEQRGSGWAPAVAVLSVPPPPLRRLARTAGACAARRAPLPTPL